MGSKAALARPADLSLLQTDGNGNMVCSTGKNIGSRWGSEKRVNVLARVSGSSR